MAEDSKRELAPVSWWSGLKSEFGKITWPDRKTLAKQTAAVAIVSVLLGLVIALVDVLVEYGVKFLVHL